MNYKKIRKKTLKKISQPDQEIITYLTNDPQFDFLKNQATQIMYHQFGFYIKAVCKEHFTNKEIKILDWGCGHGQCSFILKNLGLAVEAADVDERPILKNKGITFTRLTHEFKLPFSDDSFEAITSFGVLEHVPNEPESLKEIYRVLKPGGLFFCFNLPYFYSYGQRLAHLRDNYYHDRLYLESKIKKILKQSGYELLDYWHLGLLPKNTINYHGLTKSLEKIDQFLTRNTPLKYLATSLNFLAIKK